MESKKELTAFKFHMAVASAHANALMIAGNVLARVTNLMSSHRGIVPQLLIEDMYPFESDKAKFPKNASNNFYIHLSDSKISFPKGIEFIKVD